jgi:Pectate lyase superfamily protein
MAKITRIILGLGLLTATSAKPYLPAYIRYGGIDKNPLQRREFELESGIPSTRDGFIGSSSTGGSPNQNAEAAAPVVSAAAIPSPAVASPAASPHVVPSAIPYSTTSSNGTTAGAPAAPGSSTYWVSDIKRQGTAAFGAAGYKVFRNVKDYGAKGDGTTDDTAAINAAITDGNRCGQGCDSSTVTPALVFFPSGSYVISAPIVQLYYTQLVGDAIDLPTLKAAPAFTGMAVIDADPYVSGVNYYTNQNNFFRQVRNFVIDLTGITAKNSAGIHWQVGQAASIQNVRFEMVQGTSSQSGIFMDNGSGQFFSDLTFNGGNYGTSSSLTRAMC